jgi:hypothetical protein
LKIANRLLKTDYQLGGRRPTEHRLGQVNVRLSLLWVILRKRLKDQFALRRRYLGHESAAGGLRAGWNTLFPMALA